MRTELSEKARYALLEQGDKRVALPLHAQLSDCCSHSPHFGFSLCCSAQLSILKSTSARPLSFCSGVLTMDMKLERQGLGGSRCSQRCVLHGAGTQKCRD